MAETIPGTSIFAGEDSIGRERACEELFGRVRSVSAAVTVELFDPDREGIGSFLERMMTGSMFMDVKLCHVRHASQMDEPELRSIADFAGYRVPDVYLVVEADDLGASAASQRVFGAWLDEMVKKGKKNDAIQVRLFNKPRDYEIAKWLVSQVPALFKRRIALKDAEHFVDLVGYEFDTIYSELQKIDIFLEPGQAVTAQAIDEVIEPGRAITPFELAQALGRKDLVNALTAIDSLFSAGITGPPCIAALVSHFWTVFRVRNFLQAEPETARQYVQVSRTSDRVRQNSLAIEIAIGAGIMEKGQEKRIFPAVIKPGIINQAQDYSTGRLLRIFRELRDLDVEIKTGRTQWTKTILQTFCFSIVRGG